LDGLALSDSSDDDVEQEEAKPDAEEVESKDGRFDDANELSVDTYAVGAPQLDAQSIHTNSATASNKHKSRRHMPKRIRKKVCT
jgi:hypothetical protein